MNLLHNYFAGYLANLGPRNTFNCFTDSLSIDLNIRHIIQMCTVKLWLHIGA